MIYPNRLEVANKVVDLLLENRSAEFHVKNGKLYLKWIGYKDQEYSLPWATRPGSCYPSWSDKLSTGDTYITAIAQLANWVRGRAAYPIQWWKYQLGKDVEMVSILMDSDYPKERKCIFCGSTGQLDWYNFPKDSKLPSGMACWTQCKPLKDLYDAYIRKINK